MKKDKKIIFTIPYAGGNKFSFKEYDLFLKDDFDIYHLELPGRGERFLEDLITDIDKVIDDLYNQIKDRIDSEYVLYGHSLGGLLGYLLILMLEEKELPIPSNFIVSGRANPSMKPPSLRHNLPKDDFIKSLKELGGMPSEFFNHSELFDLFEPILRADFMVVEKFDFNEKRKIGSKISVLYGRDESFSINEAMKWKDFSYQNINFHEFSGGHFFILDHGEDICKIIRNDIQ